MTALEYMQQQLSKHRISYGRAVLRRATEEELKNLQDKIEYYSKAVEALRKEQ